MGTSSRAVAISAGVSLAVVAIGVAFALGRRSAVPGTVYVNTPANQRAAFAQAPEPAQPIRVPASDEPSPPSPPTEEQRVRLLATRIAGLEGEPLVDALWTFETQIEQRVTYAQLERNAARYDGEPAVFTGRVLQIMDQPAGTFIRLGTGDYESRVIAVFSIEPPSDSIVANRRVRAYGYLSGSYTYESQAGWQITVPQMRAVAVVLADTPRRAGRLPAAPPASHDAPTPPASPHRQEASSVPSEHSIPSDPPHSNAADPTPPTHHTCYRSDGTPQQVPSAIPCSALHYNDRAPARVQSWGEVTSPQPTPPAASP